MKVFGIGLHRTGTTTLATCFRELGLSTTSYDLELTKCAVRGELAPIFEAAERYEAFEDWPWPLVYREMHERYPESKFILTTRKDSKRWLRSLVRHAAKTGPTEARRLVYGHAMPDGRAAEHVAFYEEHNRRVREYFHGRANFVELCWEDGDGWEELCGFLGRPVPDVRFPHRNRTAPFWRRSVKELAKGARTRLAKPGLLSAWFTS